MTKKSEKAEASAETRVVLACVYSGLETSYGPGDVIAVDAEEAERLIDLGAAKPFVEAESSAAADE